MDKRIRDQVDLIGNNIVHIKEYCAARRPDCLQNVTLLSMNDGHMLLMALAYAAGRASVVAELEKCSITDVARG